VQQQRVGAGRARRERHRRRRKVAPLRWRRRRSASGSAKRDEKPVAKAKPPNDGAGKERSSCARAAEQPPTRVRVAESPRGVGRDLTPASTPRLDRDPGARGQSRRQRVAPDHQGGHVAEIDPATWRGRRRVGWRIASASGCAGQVISSIASWDERELESSGVPLTRIASSCGRRAEVTSRPPGPAQPRERQPHRRMAAGRPAADRRCHRSTPVPGATAATRGPRRIGRIGLAAPVTRGNHAARQLGANRLGSRGGPETRPFSDSNASAAPSSPLTRSRLARRRSGSVSGSAIRRANSSG